MSSVLVDSLAQKRISYFVKWIAPDPETRSAIKSQSDEIRTRICKRAEEDKLVILSTPYGGSFPKKTGLRRNYKGHSEVPGQDIDLPFVVQPSKEDEYVFKSLISRFFKYAHDAYPKTEIETTKSSVKMKFAGTGIEYDIVPLLATNDKEIQIIHKNSEDIKTSVQKHVQFIKSRTKTSSKVEGCVLFNECIRLFKWWRYFQYEKHYKNLEVSSVVIDMLCAKAFDNCSISSTYIETIARWSSYLAHILNNKTPIYFTDYISKPKFQNNQWGIFDPVNVENNFCRNWSNYQVEALADWFAEMRDLCNRIIRSDFDGDSSESLEYLVELFGNPFANHCEEEN
jgi:hypothetical protein